MAGAQRGRIDLRPGGRITWRPAVFSDPYTHMSQLDAELQRTMRQRELERVLKHASKQPNGRLLNWLGACRLLDVVTGRRQAVRQSGTSAP
jgi:hypothetical protein